MSEAALALLGPREEPGRWASAVLTLGMHLLLAAVLVYGVRWQIRPPEPVAVELIRSLPPLPVAAPVAEPIPEPAPPDPAPEIKPAPPRPEPTPAPKPTAKAPPEVAKPDIAVKVKPKKPEPKPEPKAKPAPPKPEPKPTVDPLAEMLRKDERRLAEAKRNAAIDRELSQLKESRASAARQTATDAWLERIRSKIRGNIVLPPNVHGNPEAEFAVVLLPSGDVLSVRLARSSGNAALDTAIERAIRKSSPLPKPEQADIFERDLRLQVRPLDE